MDPSASNQNVTGSDHEGWRRCTCMLTMFEILPSVHVASERAVANTVSSAQPSPNHQLSSSVTGDPSMTKDVKQTLSDNDGKARNSIYVQSLCIYSLPPWIALLYMADERTRLAFWYTHQPFRFTIPGSVTVDP